MVFIIALNSLYPAFSLYGKVELEMNLYALFLLFVKKLLQQWTGGNFLPSKMYLPSWHNREQEAISSLPRCNLCLSLTFLLEEKSKEEKSGSFCKKKKKKRRKLNRKERGMLHPFKLDWVWEADNMTGWDKWSCKGMLQPGCSRYFTLDDVAKSAAVRKRLWFLNSLKALNVY